MIEKALQIIYNKKVVATIKVAVATVALVKAVNDLKKAYKESS